MKLSVLSCVLLLFVFFKAQGQTALMALKTKLLTADSVVIVSHEHSLKIEAVDGKSYSPWQPLVKNGKPNPKVIHERKRLEDTAVQRLGEILMQTLKNSKIEMARCFMPHHAVFLFSKGKLSFIDICFDCFRLAASRNIRISESDFDYQKWNNLYTFFVQSGLKYQLNR